MYNRFDIVRRKVLLKFWRKWKWFLLPEHNCWLMCMEYLHNSHAKLPNELQIYIKADTIIPQWDWNECWSRVRVCLYHQHPSCQLQPLFRENYHEAVFHSRKDHTTNSSWSHTHTHTPTVKSRIAKELIQPMPKNRTQKFNGMVLQAPKILF